LRPESDRRAGLASANPRKAPQEQIEADLIDAYRDLLTSSMDVFLTTVSNRLNVVMKQLAVIATIFLPLTFITGFFGQNFGWMVGHIASWPVFVGLGIGTELFALAILMTFFKRRGWF
jgi:magnesium transporter